MIVVAVISRVAVVSVGGGLLGGRTGGIAHRDGRKSAERGMAGSKGQLAASAVNVKSSVAEPPSSTFTVWLWVP